MIKWVKNKWLVLRWMNEIVKTSANLARGGFFIFRDSPVEFLKYLDKRNSEIGEVKRHDLVSAYLAELDKEIIMRKRRGEW